MPLLSDKNLNATTRLLVWDITESVSWLRDKVTLNEVEEGLYATFKHDVRRKQWLAVRLLLQKHFSGKVNFSIDYNEFGKPYFKEIKLNISLSHSHQLAGIIISQGLHVGLDIESLSHEIVQLQNKFLSTAELQMIKDEMRNEQLHVLWCAKEVMYKIYGRKKLEFKDHLKIEAFNLKPEGKLKGELQKGEEKMDFDISYEKMNGYIIAWGYKI